MKRILFDKFEAAILLDGYLQTLNGKDRKQAVKEVSESLRKMAVNRGLTIDKTFRNFTGIFMQMAVIEYLYTNGRLGLKHTSKLFSHLIDLYRTDSESYKKILNDAKTKIGEQASIPVEAKEEIESYGLNKTSSKEEVNLSIQNLEDQLDEILHEYFSEDGLYPDVIGFDDFRYDFQDKYHKEIELDDQTLEAKLEEIGIKIDGYIFSKRDKEDSSLLPKIWNDIKSTLDQGAGCIYLCCLFERWQKELADELGIYSDDALRGLLKAQNEPGYHITTTYIRLDDQNVPIWEIVDKFMQKQHVRISTNSVHEQLWFIPSSSVNQALRQNKATVATGDGQYFYAPNFPVTEKELSEIKYYMGQGIENKGYLVASDIKDILDNMVPSVGLNAPGFSDYGYREILRYFLKDDFDFNSAVVTSKGENLDVRKIYRNFCQEHPRFTLPELKQLSTDLKVVIYWDEVFKKSVRIDDHNFALRENIHFDSEKVDAVLDKMCPDEYIPIQKVNAFLLFPYASYPWNSFLLESYLIESSDFQLFHNTFSESKVCGVIVRKNSQFKNYEQVVIDILAHDDSWSTSSDAISLIVNKGLQARRKWKGFAKVVKEAGLLRENLRKERK